MQEQAEAKPKRQYRREITPEVVEHLREIGRKGGLARGAAKRRGDSAHYAQIALSRRQKAECSPTR